jgi:hypothetical protein
MRLFGVVGGTGSQKRATYGFLAPFDRVLSSVLPADPATLSLFGVPGGSRVRMRATFGFIAPFTLGLQAPPVYDPIDHGGFILDLGGVYALQYNNIMIGYPDWVFVAPAQQFNPIKDNTIIIGASDTTNVRITGSTPNVDNCGGCS